ncbi:alcohol dehydrogenase-like regulatory protein ErcA [Methanofollis fontis]|uniref:Alcohol dehydrogenase n=1 Tax=Methanofollis fontis TaxID=2052832 RepID=A0A483CVM0_9EURY|nr:alcohol dehydrogenase-like regulatory protein ErcA [Methanofollis fontis]TAJ45716.1 alcohol dehydrogenase [Methanofollis fontis]
MCAGGDLNIQESGPALRKFVAPEFIFGPGASGLAGRYARNFGIRKVLLVSDRNVASQEWFVDICRSLDDAGVVWTLFTGLSENPKSGEVMRGAEVFMAEECTGIVAVGGGSPMDCAKGIGVVSSNREHILAFEGVDEVRLPGPPLICVPTTAGSSADVSQFAIISDEVGRRKVAIISKTLVPDISLADPGPLLTLPPDITAFTGVDALVHAVEAYVSNAGSPVTDLHARRAIELVITSLPSVMEDLYDPECRYRTMMASLHAGLAFSNASLGAVHAMAHALGGYLDIAHGCANALLLEHVVAYNYPAARERYTDIARIMGGTGQGGADELASLIREFRHSVGIGGTIHDIGVGRSDIQALAVRAAADPCLATNPRTATIEDLEGIYEAAL